MFNGDIHDFESISRHPKGIDTPVAVADEIHRSISVINWVSQRTVETVVIPGNHDLRLDAALQGETPYKFKGLLGLTLREQMYGLGLDPGVRWVQESTTCRGLRVGDTRIRHGHNQARKGSHGPKYLAAKYVETELVSTITNHHHKAQSHCRTFTDIDDVVHVIQAITCPAATRPHEYWLNPDWQWGFVSVEAHAPYFKLSSNGIVLADPETGTFSYQGKTYVGDATSHSEAA